MGLMPEPKPDPIVDPFRDGVAILTRDGLVAGHLVSVVESFWKPMFPLRKQWWVKSVIVWTDGRKERAADDAAPWTWVRQITDDGELTWEAGERSPRTGTYTVRWLEPEEARQVREDLDLGQTDFYI